MSGPCGWPLVGTDGCPDLVALDDEGALGPSRADVEAMAVGWLWSWTGKRYGLCEVTLRPSRDDCAGSTYLGRTGIPDPVAGSYGWHALTLSGGFVSRVGCGICDDRCGCTEPVSIRLPGPIHQVNEVLVDGNVVDAADYRVDNGKRLVRQDGDGWPVCNDVGKPPTEPGTWQVTYLQGVPVPEGGQVAAGVLACEMAKALALSPDCRLPQRVQTITREGVTVGVLDPFDGIGEGRTGIWLVDSWVASITHAPARSTIHSPDRRPARRTTFQASP